MNEMMLISASDGGKMICCVKYRAFFPVFSITLSLLFVVRVHCFILLKVFKEQLSINCSLNPLSRNSGLFWAALTWTSFVLG